MKKYFRLFLTVLLIAAAVYLYFHNTSTSPPTPFQKPAEYTENRDVTDAFNAGRSDVQVRGTGIVQRVMNDDTRGDRHQRFIVSVNAGQTVLIAHNIDLAPRIPGLRKGDTVEFYGEYEWNARGGVVHWTHRDPQGRHPDGWLKHRGRQYD